MVHHTVSLEIGNPQEVKNNMVKVHIKYPKDFKGTKFLKDGDEKEMAPETADHLVKVGIAFYEKPVESDAVKEPKATVKKSK